MIAITLSDLRYRLRQFLIAVVGAGLVFALALLLSGIVAGFHNEIRRTVDAVGADYWVVPAKTSGPFTSVAAMPGAVASQVAHTKGVTKSSPVAIALQSVRVGDTLLRSMVIGAVPGALGQVTPSEGKPIRKDGQAVIDERLGVRLGGTFQLDSRTLTVVGIVKGLTVLGAAPDVWISLHDAQSVLFGGQSLITCVVVKGHPANLPPAVRAMTRHEVRTDTLVPLKSAVDSVNNTRWFMWIVAAVIVAALVYVSALQRLRDFAVMKAVGASSRSLFVGVALQSVLVTALSAVLAASTANLLKPIYTLPVEVPSAGYLSLPVVAIVVGILASLVALRQAVKVDPALAFGAN